MSKGFICSPAVINNTIMESHKVRMLDPKKYENKN